MCFLCQQRGKCLVEPIQNVFYAKMLLACLQEHAQEQHGPNMAAVLLHMI